VDNFEYKKMPPMRFIGQMTESHTCENTRTLFDTLDAMTKYKSGFDNDIALTHHYGKGVDQEPMHTFFGRFMKADAPVPDGFVSFDFVQEHDGEMGLPFVSEFAFAAFSGDIEAMHKADGYDYSAMYTVTRNIILGQGVHIPYPHKYWVAEVFLDGYDRPGTAFLFSVEGV